MKNLKTKQFVQKAQEEFPQFDYSLVENFTNLEKDKVIIICPEHGQFTISPRNLLKSTYGCPECAKKLKGKKLRSDKNDISSNLNTSFDCISEPLRVEKTKLIGTVYCFINKINNKIYIGETVKSNYEERFNEHKSKAELGIVNYFYNAIRKYGWDNFDKIILFQTEVLDNTDENKIILNDIVNEKEVYYINYYNSFNPNKGYNLTKGGDGVVGYKHSEETKKLYSEQRSGENHWKYGKNNVGGHEILQFDLDFNLIQTWPSMSEISRQLGYNSNNISNCCNNKLIKYKGFIWVRKSDYFEGYLEKYKSRAKCTSSDRSVLQYDFDGNLVNKFISCKQAGDSLGKGSVSTAASGRDSQLHGYIWIYESEFTEELLQDRIERAKSSSKYKQYLKMKENI